MLRPSAVIKSWPRLAGHRGQDTLGKLRVGRRAVSNMISGIIVLALFLIALGAMVAFTQQFDTYQSTVDSMSQLDINRNAEKIQPVYPGLKGGFQASGCSTCNQYNMSLANIGNIAVQLARIYINSTAQPPGCTPTNTKIKSLCILTPQSSPTPFGFDSYDSYINPGETNHIVRLWLPQTVTLPNVTLTPSNSIWIVTNRGRVFSFNWPFPPAGQGVPGAGSPPTIYAGVMAVAYNGTDNSASDACHTEKGTTLPAGGASTTLHYVNPWITSTVMSDLAAGSTDLYVAVYSSNSLSVPVTFSWGGMVILTADAASSSKPWYIGGPYVGIVYNQSGVRHFAARGTNVAINPGNDYYLIFQITQQNLSPKTPTPPGDSFSGTAAMNNGYGASGEDASFRQIDVFLNGLYVRTGCT